MVMTPFQVSKVWVFPHHHLGGIQNMALDDWLLDWAGTQSQPVLILRTYTWRQPTLSLGVHQPLRDLPRLVEHYQQVQPDLLEHLAIVQRPTGGRAILHGRDVSFSFVTNSNVLLKQSLKDSYCLFSGWITHTLQDLSVPVQCSTETDGKAYLRSAVCFETQTPSDLLDTTGKKIVGSAQLRRANGILQHGAVFVAGYGCTTEAFHQQLVQTVTQAIRKTAEPFPEAWETQPSFMAVQNRYADYSRESAGSLASVSTIIGSHLDPASS